MRITTTLNLLAVVLSSVLASAQEPAREIRRSPDGRYFVGWFDHDAGAPFGLIRPVVFRSVSDPYDIFSFVRLSALRDTQTRRGIPLRAAASSQTRQRRLGSSTRRLLGSGHLVRSIRLRRSKRNSSGPIQRVGDSDSALAMKRQRFSLENPIARRVFSNTTSDKLPCATVACTTISREWRPFSATSHYLTLIIAHEI